MSFNDRLGMRRSTDPAGAPAIELDATVDHQVAPGTVHFAVLTTLGEVAAAQAAATSVVPASVHIQLMRRAQPGLLVARGRVLKPGRTLIFAEGEVFQGTFEEKALVAKVTVTFAVI